MDPAVGAAAWAVVGGVAAVLLVVLAATLTLLVVRRSEHRRTRRQDTADADVEALHARVEELTEELRRTRATVLPASEFVITTAGDPDEAAPRGEQVPETAVLTATLGEPLVKAAAWTYGLRRALSPENRNRIAFEMRREVKRARKERRRAARRAAARDRTSGGRHAGQDAEESAA